MNAYAESGVKTPCMAFIMAKLPSATPNNELKVDTTTSFATRPNSMETEACQLPNPRGANIGAIAVPIMPMKLSCDP